MAQLVCIDDSGSTGHSSAYWNYVESVFNEHPEARFIAWNNCPRDVSRKTLASMIRNRIGSGSTRLSALAPLLLTPQYSTICLITDGQVEQHEVDHADMILKNKKFERVSVHCVSTGGPMNLSVGAPLMRNCESFSLKVDGRELAAGSTHGDIDLDKYATEPELLLSEFDALNAQIVIRCVGGRSDLALRERLSRLNTSLAKAILARESSTNPFAAVRGHLELQRLDDARAEMRRLALSAGDTTSLAKRVDLAIQALMRSCTTKDFSFAQLQPGRLALAATVAEPPLAQVQSESAYTGNFQCPVALDDDLPVICIAKGTPLFDGLEKGYVEALMTNPFMLLANDDLCQKLRDRVDHPIGLGTIENMASEQGRIRFKSVFTRRKICAVVALGHDRGHAEATNFALARLFFGQKLVGVPELWLAVFLFAVRTHVPWLADNSDVMEPLESHLVWRLRTFSGRLSLSGLPLAPLMRAPLDLAVWYCVEMSWRLPAMQNRLRDYGAHATRLVDLLEMLKMPFDRAAVMKRIACYRAAVFLQRSAKASPDTWYDAVRAQYQNSIVLANGKRVFLDGPAAPPLPPLPVELADLSLAELVALTDCVDTRISDTGMAIPDPLVPRRPLAVTNYTYPEGAPHALSVPICPATMRPYTFPRPSTHWTEASKSVFGPLNGQLHVNALYLLFVETHKRFPLSDDELIEFAARRQMSREDGQCKDTLPAHVRVSVNSCLSDYALVLAAAPSIDVARFLKIVEASRNRVAREAMEV